MWHWWRESWCQCGPLKDTACYQPPSTHMAVDHCPLDATDSLSTKKSIHQIHITSERRMSWGTMPMPHRTQSDIHSPSLVRWCCHSIREGHWVVLPWWTSAAVFSHLPVLPVPWQSVWGTLFPDLPRDRGEADWPVNPSVFLSSEVITFKVTSFS